MLSPTIRKHWAIAYNVTPETVYKWIKKIQLASYKTSSGNWEMIVRPSIGVKTIIPCVNKVVSAARSNKLGKREIKEISKETGITLDTINSIIEDLT